MKILVADKISPTGVQFLKNQPGFTVVEAYNSSREKLLELVSDVSAIAVRSESKITAEILAAAPKLVCVGRAGVGVDNVDVEAATKRGVIVMNTPSGNTIATAELTFTHLLLSARPVAQAHATMRDGQWDRKSFSGIELHGKTLGILGLGRIGAEVAKRALAFGMKVLAYDPYLTEARAKSLNVKLSTLDEIFSEIDFLTVHMPLTEQTTNLVDAAAFAKMKKGARIVNCARGGLVNEAALIDAVKSGKVSAVGFDVFVTEPLPKDSEFRALPGVVLTPHLGASTAEAQESCGLEIAQAITQVLNGGSIINAVNMPSVDSRTLEVLRPYLRLGETLGALLQQVAVGKVTQLRISYWGRVAEFDTLPLSRSIQRGWLKRISGEHVNDVNAPHVLKQLGVSVEMSQSSTEPDYKELVQLEAVTESGARFSVAGTLIGTAQAPRIVALNGHQFEFSPEGTLLILENKDVPGIVGALGTILGSDRVNIANMALSRTKGQELALAVYQLDSAPSDAAFSVIKQHHAIASARIVQI